MTTPRLKCLQPRLATTAAKPLWSPDSQRGNRHDRGYGYAWEKARARVLERDCGLCQPCKAQGVVTLATQVDHIKPKCDGGTDHERNLQAICTPCHDAKSRREMKRGGG